MNPVLDALSSAPDRELAEHPGLRRLRAAVRRARPVLVPEAREHEALVRAFEEQVRRRCAVAGADQRPLSRSASG